MIYTVRNCGYLQQIISLNAVFANFMNAFLCKVIYGLNASRRQIISRVALYAKASQFLKTLFHLLCQSTREAQPLHVKSWIHTRNKPS